MKKTLSLFLSIIMLFTTTGITIYADGEPTAVTAEEQMHNIAERYAQSGIADDENMIWFAADFADYLTLYPETENVLSNDDKQACIDNIIETANQTTSQSDLAKCIIVLRALGYDARNTYTKDETALDIVSKLTNLITEDSVTAPWYEYTLPYVLIALSEGGDYAPAPTLEMLLNFAVSEAGKAAWQDTTYGVDGITPMLRALAPYCAENSDVQSAVDESVELIKGYQGKTGNLDNAASISLAIAGLCATGIDPENFDGHNLIDDLMSYTNESYDGFEPASNSFSTEQGFRGLIASKLFESGKTIYDFKNNPTNEARATLDVAEPTPEATQTPEATTEPTAEPTATPTPTATSRPSGGGGSYRPTPSASPTPTPTPIPSGLPNKHADVRVMPITDKGRTFPDIKDHKNQVAIETLAERGIIDGMDDETYAPDSTMTRAQFSAIIVRALGLPEKDGFDFNDVSKTDWFFGYINTAYHYGIINGVSNTEFNPNGLITREEAATMIARASMLCGMNTNMTEDGIRNSLAEFTDYTSISDWASSSMAFCFFESLLDKDVLEINPKEEITRAEMAQIIYNTLSKSKLL